MPHPHPQPGVLDRRLAITVAVAVAVIARPCHVAAHHDVPPLPFVARWVSDQDHTGCNTFTDELTAHCPEDTAASDDSPGFGVACRDPARGCATFLAVLVSDDNRKGECGD